MALDNLNQFSGSEEVYRLTLLPHVLFTEGMKYVADEAKAYWLMTVIATRCLRPAKSGEEFLAVTFTLDDRQSGEIIIDDGNGNVLEHQTIASTDFPLKEFRCYAVTQGPKLVVMLPSEY